MVKKGVISKNWQDSDEARKRLQDRIDQYKKNKVKLNNSTTNENKSRKDKSTSLIVSATFFNQYQSTATQIDLDHSDTLNENLMKIVRIGPSETVYWLGGPSVSDVLQWDWIFVKARLMKQ
jgi:hypothetical protein